jgi:hypothetical protein
VSLLAVVGFEYKSQKVWFLNLSRQGSTSLAHKNQTSQAFHVFSFSCKTKNLIPGDVTHEYHQSPQSDS